MLRFFFLWAGLPLRSRRGFIPKKQFNKNGAPSHKPQNTQTPTKPTNQSTKINQHKHIRRRCRQPLRHSARPQAHEEAMSSIKDRQLPVLSPKMRALQKAL